MQRHDSDPVLSKKALMEGFSLDSKILPKQHSEPGPMIHERKPKFLIEGPGKNLEFSPQMTQKDPIFTSEMTFNLNFRRIIFQSDLWNTGRTLNLA